MRQFVLSLTILFVLGCDNDNSEENLSNETKIDLVTGINIRNSAYSTATQLGNPNINNNDNFILFPNPPIGNLFLLSNNQVSDIWIVPSTAEKLFQQVDFDDILNSDLYSENNIDSKSELKLLNQNSSEIALNLENLGVGYYKIFVKIDGDFYWDNIFVSDGSINIEELIDFWN